jgi:hypothetical protein
VERRKKEFDAVREAALERFVLKKKQQMARDDAEAFQASLKEKSRAVEEVAQLEKELHEAADQAAEKTIELRKEQGEEISDAEAEKIRQVERGKYRREIDTLAERQYHRFFDDEAASRGLTIKSIDYFRKSINRSPEFYEREDSEEKFLMGNNPRVFGLDSNGVSDLIHDGKGETWYLVRVLDRRFPPPSAMTQTDIEAAKRRKQQMEAMRRQYPQIYQQDPVEDPFAFDKIVERYQLQILAEEQPGEGEPAGEEGETLKAVEEPAPGEESETPDKSP